jgi:hypothetical protein
MRRQAVLPSLTFEPEIQAETDQKSPKNPGKCLQNAHEVPVLVEIGNFYLTPHEATGWLMIQ